MRPLEEASASTGCAALSAEAALGFGKTVCVPVQLDMQGDGAQATFAEGIDGCACRPEDLARIA